LFFFSRKWQWISCLAYNFLPLSWTPIPSCFPFPSAGILIPHASPFFMYQVVTVPCPPLAPPHLDSAPRQLPQRIAKPPGVVPPLLPRFVFSPAHPFLSLFFSTSQVPPGALSFPSPLVPQESLFVSWVRIYLPSPPGAKSVRILTNHELSRRYRGVRLVLLTAVFPSFVSDASRRHSIFPYLLLLSPLCPPPFCQNDFLQMSMLQ